MATLLLTALTAEGGALAGIGFVTQLVLSTAAVYVDSQVVYPALFPPEEVKGPRLNNFEFQHAEEGAPANRLFGKEVRVAGTIIWAGALREIEDRDRGGKGGQGGDFVKFKYYRHVAIEIARLKRGKVIKGVKKVIADGRPFFDPEGIGSASSNKIRVDPLANYSVSESLGEGEAGVAYNYYVKLVSDESAGGPALDEFQSGQLVTLAGFTNTNNSLGTAGNVKIEHTGASPDAHGTGERFAFIAVTVTGKLSVNDTMQVGSTTYTIKAVIPSAVTLRDENGQFRDNLEVYQSIDFTGTVPSPQTAHVMFTAGITNAAQFTDGANALITSGASANNGTWLCNSVGRTSSGESFMTLFDHPESFFEQTFCGRDQNIDTITITQEDRTFPETIAKDVRFYNGSRNQPQDSTIVAEEADNVGGAANVPAFRSRAYMVIEDLELTDFGNRIPNFEFDVEVEDDPTVANAVGEMLQDAGVPPSDYDLSLIPSSLQLGGYVMRGVQNTKAAFQPLSIAFHLLSQQTEKLRIFQRTSATLIDVTGKTVAFVPGNRVPRPGRFRTVGDAKVRQIAYVKYFDPANDFQIARKKAKSPVPISAQADVFETNMVMTGDEAQRLVNTLYELGQTTGRRAVTITLPPSFIPIIRESIRVRLNKFNQDRTYLILRADLGANFILECDAIEDDQEAFTQNVTSEGTLA